MSDEDEQVEQTTVQLKATLDKLVKQNIALEQSLIDQKIKPNPYVIGVMRLNLLLDILLTEEVRFQYEIESAKRIHEILMSIQQEVHANKDAAKLFVPTPGNVTLLPPTVKGFSK